MYIYIYIYIFIYLYIIVCLYYIIDINIHIYSKNQLRTLACALKRLTGLRTTWLALLACAQLACAPEASQQQHSTLAQERRKERRASLLRALRLRCAYAPGLRRLRAEALELIIRRRLRRPKDWFLAQI